MLSDLGNHQQLADRLYTACYEPPCGVDHTYCTDSFELSVILTAKRLLQLIMTVSGIPYLFVLTTMS